MNDKRKTAPITFVGTNARQSSHNTISISEKSGNVKNGSFSVPVFAGDFMKTADYTSWAAFEKSEAALIFLQPLYGGKE